MKTDYAERSSWMRSNDMGSALTSRNGFAVTKRPPTLVSRQMSMPVLSFEALIFTNYFWLRVNVGVPCAIKRIKPNMACSIIGSMRRARLDNAES